jgi:hypothetical protein
MPDPNTDTIGGTLNTADDVVAALKARMSELGVSYATVEYLAAWGENSLAKYLGDVRSRKFTLDSLLRVTAVLGLRMNLVVDDELTRQVSAEWGNRDEKRVHARRQPRLGRTTLRRVLPAAAAEMGRRGAAARLKATTAEQRRNIGRLGAMVRWQKMASMRVKPLTDPTSPLKMWLDDPPDGAPE